MFLSGASHSGGCPAQLRRSFLHRFGVQHLVFAFLHVSLHPFLLHICHLFSSGCRSSFLAVIPHVLHCNQLGRDVHFSYGRIWHHYTTAVQGLAERSSSRGHVLTLRSISSVISPVGGSSRRASVHRATFRYGLYLDPGSDKRSAE